MTLKNPGKFCSHKIPWKTPGISLLSLENLEKYFSSFV
jgi:hypothetical protein